MTQRTPRYAFIEATLSVLARRMHEANKESAAEVFEDALFEWELVKLELQTLREEVFHYRYSSSAPKEPWWPTLWKNLVFMIFLIFPVITLGLSDPGSLEWIASLVWFSFTLGFDRFVPPIFTFSNKRRSKT
jgi:hypothetical protein